MSTAPQTIRIVISSPGDVATERDRAKDVVTLCGRWYGDRVKLLPVLWEELPLTIEMPFQDQIDVVLFSESRLLVQPTTSLGFSTGSPSRLK